MRPRNITGLCGWSPPALLAILSLLVLGSAPAGAAPTKPTNVQATAVSSSQIDLTWSPATSSVGVAEYIVLRCEGAGCLPEASVGRTTTTSYSDTGLAPATTYRYRIRVRDEAGEFNTQWAISTATTDAAGVDTEPPTKPTNVQATTVSSSEIDLAWTASTDNVGVTEYIILRCEGAGCTPTVRVGSTPNTSYRDSGLAAGTTYRYRIRVTDAAGNFNTQWAISTATTLAAQQACSISVAPTALTFGNVDVSTTATASTTITNRGTAACNVTLVRSGSPDFSVSGATTFNVAAGALRAVSVNYTPAQVGADSGNLAINSNDPTSPTVNVALTGTGVQQTVNCTAGNAATSINSTSQNGCPGNAVPEQPKVANNSYSVLAINDLGMHCGDLDTRIASILPPFQVLLAQVVQKNTTPTLNPAGVSVYYSAASNPNDPTPDVFDGLMGNGDTYKTNFWDSALAGGTYDPFYPAYNPFNPAQTLTPLVGPPFNITPDTGLPVPNVEHLYIGPDGRVNSGDESLTAVTHAMPGIAGPYTANAPKLAEEHYTDKPFFVDFPFGYVAADVNWYEGAGVPFASFDDYGRENAYPLVRVQAKNAAGTVLSTVDTVLPISGEASCANCHTTASDYASVNGVPNDYRSAQPVTALSPLPVATTADDPSLGDLPPRVSLEYAADINVLRLHDKKHGARYVSTLCDTAGENCLQTSADPCLITAANPNGSPSCLVNKALVQNEPVVCQVCHYTPALDLAQLGPLAGPQGTIANGRNQLAHQSNSRVMHNHHGQFTTLFPAIPPAVQNAQGVVTNQTARLNAMENSCYQCHPGKNVQCLRGAMFNGDMLCSDCHGSMAQVGADFSAGVSPTNPGAFVLNQGNFYTPGSTQPRVPWANEPGCGSCHTGDAVSSLAGTANVRVNTRDSNGRLDGLRLRQAFRNGDAKATPIVPTNKRFAEPVVPASFNGFANPGAGNPRLYRVSNGHGGVMCEGCHGATHAEFPNANPNANDNLAANQLQGHSGTIADCTTCHGTTNPGNNLNGPHGLHPIAAGSTPWSSSSNHRSLGNNYSANCQACHGGTSRNNSCGTPLSRALANRTFSGRTVAKGQPVGCAVCHSSSYWNSTCATQ